MTHQESGLLALQDMLQALDGLVTLLLDTGLWHLNPVRLTQAPCPLHSLFFTFSFKVIIKKRAFHTARSHAPVATNLLPDRSVIQCIGHSAVHPPNLQWTRSQTSRQPPNPCSNYLMTRLLLPTLV